MNGEEKEPMLSQSNIIDGSGILSGDPDLSPDPKPEENKFGFGVPEERKELDPTIFDDEFDTKAAFRFDKAQKFENGVEKEFQKMKNGEIPTFYSEEEEPEEANWTKMPSSLNEFNSIRMAVAAQIFGDKPDKILDSINNFMRKFQELRESMKDNFFPSALLTLVYLPFYLVVMLLNCLKEALMWWIVAIVLGLIFCAVIGALSTLAFTAYRGYKIYSSRFGSEGEANEEEPAPTEASSE